MIRPHFQILPDYIASRSLLRCVMLPITHAFAPYHEVSYSLLHCLTLPITHCLPTDSFGHAYSQLA